MEGIDNQEGGVCRTQSMKMTMKVGQSEYPHGAPVRWRQAYANRPSPRFLDPSDPSPKDNPTRVPNTPKRTDSKGTDNRNEVLENPGESG